MLKNYYTLMFLPDEKNGASSSVVEFGELGVHICFSSAVTDLK
jgi:hypothetical protein